MEAEIDHYAVLGLPSGEEGAKLTDKEINKAYRWKALELHPDKRPHDANAAANFQQLRTSYDILRDDKARKLFDDLLRVKRDRELRNSQRDGKRRKMVSDLERRERDANAPDPAAKEREEEARIARQLKEEIARIRAMHGKKEEAAVKPAAKKKESGGGGGGGGVDQEKVLKVSWEKVGEDYAADKLRELFSKFGAVEDVVIKGSKKKGSALVVMATKEGAVSFSLLIFFFHKVFRKQSVTTISTTMSRFLGPLQPQQGLYLSVISHIIKSFLEEDFLGEIIENRAYSNCVDSLNYLWYTNL